MPFRQALASIVAGLDLPFGYTLTVWSSGAIATHYFGTPELLEILAFILGAVSAYITLGLVTARRLRSTTPLRMHKALLTNLGALVAAGLVLAVLQLIATPALGFLVAGAIGTLAYALALTLALWLSSARSWTPE